MATTSNKDKEFEEEDSVESAKMFLRNNKRALKTTRKIEIGWKRDNRRVTKRQGGGSRIIDISKKPTKKVVVKKKAHNYLVDSEKQSRLYCLVPSNGQTL